MDLWTILAAVWLPIAGIALALCLYEMTEAEATPIQPRRSPGQPSSRRDGPAADEVFPSSSQD